MKKAIILSICFILAICSASYAVDYSVTRLAAAAANFAGGVMTVPALARSSAYGVKNVALAIPAARMAKIMTSVAALGGGALLGYGMEKMTEYIGSQIGYKLGTDGIMYQSYHAGEILYAGDVLTDGWSGTANGTPFIVVFAGVFPSSAIADREAAKVYAGHTTKLFNATNVTDGYTSSNSHWPPRTQMFDPTYLQGRSYTTATASSTDLWVQVIAVYPKPGCEARYNFDGKSYWDKATSGEVTTLQSTIQSGLASGTAAVVNAAKEAIRAVAGALSNPSGNLGRSPGMPAIKAELDGSISADQKTAIDATNKTAEEYANDAMGATDAADTPSQSMSPSDVKNAIIEALIARGVGQSEVQAAVEAAIAAQADIFAGSGTGGLTAAQAQTAIINALTAQGLSKEDVTEAVQDAVGGGETPDATGITPEGMPEPPEKKDFEGVLNAFKNAILALPILSMLDDMEVVASGSPVVSFSVPGFMGGGSQTITVDFSVYESTWLWMGQMLLMFTGIKWTIFLFE